MLNHQLLSFDANGHVRCSLTLLPNQFNGGTPTNGDLLCLAEVPPVDYVGGWTFAANGCACAVQGLNPANGPFAEGGQVAVSVANTGVAWYWCGLPFLANGRMAVSFGVIPPPIGPGAYDQGFDNAYDNGSP